jgi:hypothetical protein
VRILLAASLVLLAGCGAPDTVPVEAPGEIAIDCEADLPCAEAAAEWNAALGATRLVLAAGGLPVLVVGDNSEPCGPDPWRGCTRVDRVELWAPAWRGTADPAAVKLDLLLHELGHVVSAQHTESGVMHPRRVGQWRHVDAVSAASVLR